MGWGACEGWLRVLVHLQLEEFFGQKFHAPRKMIPLSKK
jgi:hypothetical protein